MTLLATGTTVTVKDTGQSAVVRGHTVLDAGLHYVLEGKCLFIRHETAVSRVTTLPEYIGDYIGLEVERGGIPGLNIALPGRMAMVRHWIIEAIDAYEGGAR